MATSKPTGGHPGGGADKPMGSSPTQYFSLRWNNHPVNLVSVFTGLYQSETLVDVTLAAEGKHLQAHKMLLSACSDYFQSLFSVNPSQHPIVILKDVRFEDLQTVVQFMYNGIVNVSSEKLPDVLKTAETLQIKGLAEKFTETMRNNSSNRRLLASASFSSSRYLSVPSQYSSGSRQLSTESLPEDYLRRTHSPRQASVESRQYSIESSLPSTTTNAAKRTVSPPLSPTRMQFRKKFRRMSGCSSDRGNSVEDDRSPGIMTASRSSPPTIHLSPSRQSSSSTDGGHGTGGAGAGNASAASGNSLSVAKKKRELFSARSSRSGGSNKSSDASMDLSSKREKYGSGSSADRQGSINQSVDGSGSNKSSSFTLSLHQSSGSSGDRQGSISQSVEEPNIVINLQTPTTSYAMLRPPRTLGRTQSAGDATPTDLSRTGSMEEPKSPLSDAGKSKRSRFALSRQDCLEKGSLGEVEQSIPTIKSTPNSPLMLGVPSPNLGSPPASLHITPSTSISESFDNTGTHDSFLADHPPPVLPPPPLAHRLPSVRVISDAVDPLSLEETTSMHYGLLHPNFRSISLETAYVPPPPPPPPRPPQRVTTPPNLPPSQPPADYQAPSMYPLPPQPIPTLPPNASTSGSQHHSVTIYGSHSSMGTPEQFGHCPKEREGPALGCNFCWNTTDVNGRILRRKTKYHCPECQANLCIVPCFQAYHEALEKDKANSADSKT